MIEAGKEYSRVQLVREYFGDVRPVETPELRELGGKGLQELAEAIAKLTGAILKIQS